MTQHQTRNHSPADQLIEALDELSFQICWTLGRPGSVHSADADPPDGYFDTPVQFALDRVRNALVAYRHPRSGVTDRV